MKKSPFIWLIASALCAIGLSSFSRAEYGEIVGVGYTLPEDREEGVIGIFMPRDNDIPDNLVYDQVRHPVKFLGFVYDSYKYGGDPNSNFCEDTYAGVWRTKRMDFQFIRFDFGYPGSDRSSVIDRGVTVGFAVTWKFGGVNEILHPFGFH